MIVPSIDMQGGEVVQLVGGKERALSAGEPGPIAERFGRVGEIAVIDLDAALGTGRNADAIRELLPIARCRVGGGIRDARSAIGWLDAGAHRVILGTAATPDVLRELPRDRVIAALDARDGEVVTEGWTKATGERVEDRIAELREYVGGFLLTFVEREGRMAGLPMDRVAELVRIAAPARVTVAGGVRTPADVADADRTGADAQVGMALYTGAFDLAAGFAAPLVSDRGDGLWPTVACDQSGRTLGLAYSNLDSLRHAIETGRGAYHSRSRGGLWIKGETSGDTQELLSVEADCDRDALRFTVRQAGGGFCHTGAATCFGDASGLAALDRTLAARVADAPEGSYTARLLGDPSLLASKLREECGELVEAGTRGEAAHEAADVIYFALVAAAARGASLEDIERELDRRALRVTRRPGDAKPAPGQPSEQPRPEEGDRA
ncbi:MAG: phosphoribosyl-ATP diphosphatase [Planctomycetota bacterium]